MESPGCPVCLTRPATQRLHDTHWLCLICLLNVKTNGKQWRCPSCRKVLAMKYGGLFFPPEDPPPPPSPLPIEVVLEGKEEQLEEPLYPRLEDIRPSTEEERARLDRQRANPHMYRPLAYPPDPRDLSPPSERWERGLEVLANPNVFVNQDETEQLMNEPFEPVNPWRFVMQEAKEPPQPKVAHRTGRSHRRGRRRRRRHGYRRKRSPGKTDAWLERRRKTPSPRRR